MAEGGSAGCGDTGVPEPLEAGAAGLRAPEGAVGRPVIGRPCRPGLACRRGWDRVSSAGPVAVSPARRPVPEVESLAELNELVE